MRVMLLILFVLPGVLFAQEVVEQDVWAPFRTLVGKWEGTGEGRSGTSRIETNIQFVLNEKYMEVKNRAVFEPQEKNPKGEEHVDWGLISYDHNRRVFVYRQFHVEGFVNQYVLDGESSGDSTFVFVSEQIENFVEGGRAKETFQIMDDGEMRTTFDLAFPGKEFSCFGENIFKRKE